MYIYGVSAVSTDITWNGRHTTRRLRWIYAARWHPTHRFSTFRLKLFMTHSWVGVSSENDNIMSFFRSSITQVKASVLCTLLVNTQVFLVRWQVSLRFFPSTQVTFRGLKRTIIPKVSTLTENNIIEWQNTANFLDHQSYLVNPTVQLVSWI